MRWTCPSSADPGAAPHAPRAAPKGSSSATPLAIATSKTRVICQVLPTFEGTTSDSPSPWSVDQRFQPPCEELLQSIAESSRDIIARLPMPECEPPHTRQKIQDARWTSVLSVRPISNNPPAAWCTSFKAGDFSGPHLSADVARPNRERCTPPSRGG